MVWIDGPNLPGKAAMQYVFEDSCTDGIRAIGGTDHRDRSWMKQRRKVLD